MCSRWWLAHSYWRYCCCCYWCCFAVFSTFLFIEYNVLALLIHITTWFSFWFSFASYPQFVRQCVRVFCVLAFYECIRVRLCVFGILRNSISIMTVSVHFVALSAQHDPREKFIHKLQWATEPEIRSTSYPVIPIFHRILIFVYNWRVFPYSNFDF